ncbi:putative type B carboxylesterase [Streptantibioticus cattleyicolor NRRL 8057 = DSM 46488]|uniref:Carboxylic ester hydrolase n=1 Tax=Streptantibioticus cattleyicolor (strain ATCC 35852 / DSM 46488 / JCM 4925 / NBRC 14057 / NRRL 8057) TaxID=1003195 RepID=F8JUV4_STREN|nr:putative type B carboxylesterase [Streptantibioticus cattleyicolor NRRL 8057 = DSM 46488]CCB78429.1 TMC biosynthetic enzyme L1 [Streptantibioticus cattleyicolor NRRL 8057 = DSM 46488]
MDARTWGPVCWQVPVGPRKKWAPIYPDAVESEDCLNLNVWSRRPGRPDPQPVLVWLHPGRHMLGGNSPSVDPWVLAAYHDVVVVTPHYRLGPWGWLYLGELAPSDYAHSSNLPVRDHLLALEWVRDNIAAFGGDPGNVTLFGLSTGASDVATLLGVPAAQGLFHKAAIYSGNADNVITLSDASEFANRFLTAAGSLADSAPDLARLDNVALRYIHGKMLRSGPVPYQPCVDGDVIPDSPLLAMGKGLTTGVPVLVSVTSDEAGMYEAVSSPKDVAEKYAEVLGDDGSTHEQKLEALTRKLYVEPAERLMSAVAGGGGTCWAQVFDYHPTLSVLARDPRLAHRAVHAVDKAALFHDLDGPLGTDADRRAAVEDQLGLINLARHGHPGWATYTAREPTAKWINPDLRDGHTIRAFRR